MRNPLLPSALLLLSLTAGGCATSSSAPQSSTKPEGVSAPEPAATYSLSGVSARCAFPIDPANLASADVAFEGTVVTLTDELATLEVDRAFSGEPGATAHLSLWEDHADALGNSGALAVGRAFLIAVSDGQIAHCLSGPADDPALQEGYGAAFGQ